MIYDIIRACPSGYDLLVCYLRFCGYTLQEIAQQTSDSKTGIYRRLQAIRERLEPGRQ